MREPAAGPLLAALVVIAVVSVLPPAVAGERSAAARVEAEIVGYARSKGETPDQFAERIGSPMWHIEAFLLEVESRGGSAEKTLAGLERFAEALKDPTRRTVLKCLGIRIPRDVEPTPSPDLCAAAKRTLGAD